MFFLASFISHLQYKAIIGSHFFLSSLAGVLTHLESCRQPTKQPMARQGTFKNRYYYPFFFNNHVIQRYYSYSFFPFLNVLVGIIKVVTLKYILADTTCFPDQPKHNIDFFYCQTLIFPKLFGNKKER